MKLLTANIPYNCEIALHGDVHEGNIASVRGAVDDVLIPWILQKRTARFFVNMGDEIDAVCSDDKRFQMPRKDNPAPALPLQQCAAVIEQYKPIAANCLCWLLGNHPYALHRFGNVTRDIVCAGLRVPYGTWTSKLKLQFRKSSLKFFLAHGVSGALRSNAKDWIQAQANMKATLKMRLQEQASDCALQGIGHTHQLLMVPPADKLLLMDDGIKLHHKHLTAGEADHSGYIEPDRRWYVNTGSLLKLYTMDGEPTYAERAGFKPIELGWIVVRIEDGKIADVRKEVIA